MLVITGTQRSGTTMIAEMISMEGYNMGISNRDEVGGFENVDICSFYRDYLGDETFPYDDFPHKTKARTGKDAHFTHLVADFAFLDLPVVKFSYLLMNPVFMSVWHKFRPEDAYHDTFLVLKRNPAHVIRSKKLRRERFDHDSFLLKQSWASLEQNFEMSLDALADYGYKFVVTPFENIINDWRINLYLEQITDIRITHSTWDKIFDPDKIHFI